MNIKKLMTGAFALALAALVLPARADLPRPNPAVAEFARGVKFTVNGYGGGTEVQTNFPVLVRLSTAITGFDYGDFYADGSDLSLVDVGFVDADGNGLSYDIDTWDTSGESLIWVNLPRMTNGTEFAMWYRSSKTGKDLNPTNVWIGYTGVWHLNESGSGGTVNTAVKDSSTNALHGTAQGQAASVTVGKIGGSWRIATDYNRVDASILIDLAADATKNAKVDALGDTFSTSFWVKKRDKETKWCVTGINRRPDGSTAGWGTQIHDPATKLRVYANGGKNQFVYNNTAMTGLNTANQWGKVDVVWFNNNGNIGYKIYWNGVSYNVDGNNDGVNLGPNPTTPIVQPSGVSLVIGNFQSATSDRAWSGELDEVRLIKGKPSDARVLADYATVNTASFLTAGTVVTNQVIERPVAILQVVDKGASHIQFGGSLSSLGGGGATECAFLAKVWKTADEEPAAWTEFAAGLAVGASFSGIKKGLDPETEYSYRLKLTNDDGEGVDSDESSGTFTTAGVAISGAGGDITRIGDDWIHYFRVAVDDETDGITNAYVFTPPSYANSVRALVVAGGGPGGYYGGGGGGAGGYIYNAALPMTPGADYAVNVGTGGVATATATGYGANGGNSSIVGTGVNIVAIGGGAGGNGKLNNQTATRAGVGGGSGGGASWETYAAGSGTSGQGNDGGTVPEGQYQRDFGAGGGGAAAAGGSIEFSSGDATKGSGAGGSGLSCDITGQTLYYAGGGSGGAKRCVTGNGTGTAGKGGNGGGGTGGQYNDVEGSQFASAGDDGFGGGGGGGSQYDAASYKGGDGGDGIVIIRYVSQGDGSTVPAPIVSLQSAVYDETTEKCDVVFRVAWGGYNAQTGKGYEDADVAIVWGFRKDSLSHTNAIKSGAIGLGTGTFPLPKQTRTVYVRALATNAVAGALSTEIVKVPFINPNAPAATVSATHGITTAGFEADVTSLGGTGATKVEGVFQVCTDEYFEDGDYLTFPVTNGTLTAVGVLKGAATGLSAHTTYFVRASLTNNLDSVLETEPFEFRTSQVDWPSGQIQPSNDNPTFTVTTNSISAAFQFTDIGEGAVSGSAWMEVAATSDFATVLASSAVTNVVAADIPATCNFMVEGLEPGTAYYVRYRVRNNGGRETSNERQWAFTTLTPPPPPPPPVTLTIPELPANVTLVSVTTNGVAVTGNAGVYTILSNDTVTITFAAAPGHRLVGDATVTVTLDGDTEIAVASIPNAEQNPDVVAPSVSPIAAKVSPRKTATLTASATGATSYRWLKNGEPIEGGTSGTLTVNWRRPRNNPTDTYQAVAVYIIDGSTEESAASAEMTVENLPMGTVIMIRGASAPVPLHDYSADYLTFRVLTPGTISWKAFGDSPLTKTIEYSINNGEWLSITSTSDGVDIAAEQGDLVRFRGTNVVYATSTSKYSGFEGGTATYDIEGNIMSLLHGDDFAESTTLPDSQYIFCSLFKNVTVVSAENLVLPATTLKNYCYRALFSGCTRLTKAPELPATTLATGCYQYMFEQCAITEAPALNATTLVQDCYRSMFTGCGSLNQITCRATSGFDASNCLKEWVKNVAAEGTFVKTATVTAWTTGVNGIPSGWNVDVLLPPPELSIYGDTIELECPAEGAEIYYRLGRTGDFALYTQPISIAADTVFEAYSTYQSLTSPTVTQTCVYATPFQRSNKDLPTWTWKSNGRTITTPYSVNAIDGHSSKYATGTFAFETSVTLEAAQPTYLWFQHADQSADIYVDNVNVGTHWGGYNAFFFDIGEYVHRGRNDIRVELRNNRGSSLAPAAGDFNFNATLGNVKLFTSPVLPAMEYGYDGFHITSTVSASSATTNATIYVETKVPTGATLKCIISDGSYAWTNTLASTGKEQTFTNTIAGTDLRLWRGTVDPHLYTVTLEIYKDGDLYHRYQRPYGFRYYEYVIDPNGYTGFLLNGEPYLLRGVCMHDDVEGKANALTDSDYDQEFAIIRELGCNFIRLAHYPHPKEVYDRCDRLGIVVQTEVPCVNKLQSTMPEDYYTHLTTQYIEMVQQHYNHPCIMFWGLSNETTTDDAAFGKEKIEGYYDLIKSMDTERMVGYVMSHSWNNPSAYYNDPKVDWFGCNIYVGWYIDKTKNDPSSQLDTRIKNTITDRNKPLAFSEYGCGGTQHCHSEEFKSTTTTGNNPRHDIEYQMWLHEGHIAAIRNYPQLLFTGQWQLFDIAVANRTEGYTECLDGENATTNDELKRLNNKGLVERDHVTKKDTFYLYKAEWNSTDKFVHICGKDYTKTTQRKLKCYTNDGDTLAMYIGDSETPRETVPVVDHIAVFSAMDFTPGVEIRVKGANSSDTVTFQ